MSTYGKVLGIPERPLLAMFVFVITTVPLFCN